ncbi:MAG: hypothetical protein QG644_564 [Patescibacteria group bacterium]|nr:hypothetical protein [Patescibacteria group bacterium]
MQLNLTSNNKRILFTIAFVVIVVLLFSLNTKSTIKNQAGQSTGLVYGDKTLSDVINTDSDLDGVLDWEEGLWGTDALKTDSDGDGVPDGTEISKLKGVEAIDDGSVLEEEENLTETDKFSREVFTTVATLSQSGTLTQETLDGLGSSLAQQIENPTVSKVFLFSDIKTTGNNTAESARIYLNSLDSIFKQQPLLYKNGYDGMVYTINVTFSDVLQKYLLDPESDKAFSGLTQITKEIESTIKSMKGLTVPSGLSVIHLDILNSFQRILENMTNTKLAIKDPIVAMGGASKYEENGMALESALNRLKVAVGQTN